MSDTAAHAAAVRYWDALVARVGLEDAAEALELVVAEPAELELADLAGLLVDLDLVLARLKACRAELEAALVAAMPEDRLEVEGLPVLERRRSTDRSAWGSAALLELVVRRALDPAGDGSLPMEPAAALERVVAALMAAAPFTPSTRWRVTGLRELGIDPAAWCMSTPGPTRVEVVE